MLKVGIITCSDKGFKGEREDISGAVIIDILEKHQYKIEKYIVLPDEKKQIEKELINMCDIMNINLIITTGGTGFSERDVTPEATKNVILKEAPGISEAIRSNSMKITKRSMLSRGISGIRNKSLIINLPGSPKACRESLDYIIEDLKHGLEILLGETFECGKE